MASNSASPIIPATCSPFIGLPCKGVASFGDAWTCPYAADCFASAGAASFFTGAYGEKVVVTLAETSSNLVVRGEQQLLSGELRRSAIRKHIHEGSGPIRPDTARWITHGIMQAVALELRHPSAEELQAYLPAVESLLVTLRNGEVLTLSECYERLGSIMLNDTQLQVSEQKSRFGGVSGLICSLAFGGVNCQEITETPSLGKYLGYVDVRLASPESPIAFAVLAPPRHLRHSADYRIVQSELGTLFGGPALYGTAFAMVESYFGGGSCSSAAILMAIANLADRGGRPLGHLDTTVLGSAPVDVSRSSNNCIGKEKGVAYRSVGLDYGEVYAALNHPATNVVGTVECVVDVALLLGVIKAFVDARCPVLLFVDCQKLWSAVAKGDPDGIEYYLDRHQDAVGTDSETHMVVIVGYSTDMKELVVHDPSFRPYFRFPVADLAAAGKGSLGIEGSTHDVYSIACVTSARIKFHLLQAIDALRNSAYGNIDLYFYKKLKSPSQFPSFRFDLALVHRDDVSEWISVNNRWGAVEISHSIHFNKDSIQRMDDEWYWAIVACDLSDDCAQLFSPSPEVTYERSVFWLVSAQSPRGTRLVDGQAAVWSARAYWSPNLPSGEILKFSERIEASHVELSFDDLASPQAIGRIDDVGDKPKRSSLLDIGFGPSLLTSSSELPLQQLLSIHAQSSRLESLELYLLRRVDLQTLIPSQDFAAISDKRHGVAEWLSMESSIAIVSKWVFEGFKSRAGLRVSAIATFFSGISSFDKSYRSTYSGTKDVSVLTQRAIVNCMRIADILWSTSAVTGELISGDNSSDDRLMPSRVVEIVLGSILDICSCDECENDRSGRAFFASTWEAKAKHVIRVLHNVVDCLGKGVDGKWQGLSGEYGFAVEIEPGEHALINSADTLDAFFELIDADPLLQRHVGLNLDIAHCILCEIPPERLRVHLHRIMNAHISDHPWMHTRDHVPGTWRHSEAGNSLELAYFDLLRESSMYPNRTLPLTSRVALELEACSLPAWCDSGISTIRRMMNISN